MGRSGGRFLNHSFKNKQIIQRIKPEYRISIADVRGRIRLTGQVEAGPHPLLLAYFIVMSHGIMVWRRNKSYTSLMKYFFERLLRSYLAADACSSNDEFWFGFDEFFYVIT
jgi:hypothetical protein